MKHYGFLCCGILGLVGYFPGVLATPLSDLTLDTASVTCKEYPKVFHAALYQDAHVTDPLSKQAVQKCLQLIEHGKESVHCFPPDAILQALTMNATYLADSLYTHRKEELVKEAGNTTIEEWLGGTKGYLLTLLRGDELLYRHFASHSKVENVSKAEVISLMEWIMEVHFLASYLENDQTEEIPDHVLVLLGVIGGNKNILEDLISQRGLKVTIYSFILALNLHPPGLAQWLNEKLHLTYENNDAIHSLIEDMMYAGDSERLEWAIHQGLISGNSLLEVTAKAMEAYPLETCQWLLGRLSAQERIHIWTELLDNQEPLLAKIKQDGENASMPVIETFLELSKASVEWGNEWWNKLSDKTKNIVTSYLTFKRGAATPKVI